MREKCLDIGTIQAFLDGELASDSLENAAHHISVCDDCTMQLAAAEEETAFAFSVLEQEFNTLVPTQRLWAKINDSIEKKRKPFWQPILAFLKNPTVTAFASLLIVFGLFVAYLNTGNKNSGDIASISETKQNPVAPISSASTSEIKDTQIPQTESESKPAEDIKLVSPQKQDVTNYRVVNANLSVNENKRKTTPQNSVPNVTPKAETVNYEYIPGEESYIKTIAALEKTIDGSQEEVLKPSAQFNLAKNIALVDNAINKMKAEVKKNPKNETAKQLLMASYQNKVDLLNSVAEKSELMASIK
jgi:hypothetical protein